MSTTAIGSDDQHEDHVISETSITQGEEQLLRIAAADARRSRILEPEPEAIAGIFDDDPGLFTRYRVSLRFTGRLLGGTPKRADIVEGWLRTKTGVDDVSEVRAMMVRVLEDQGIEITPDMTYEEMVDVSKRVAGDHMANGFRQDASGLYIESRAVKAMLKEAVNVLFGGNKERWGVTRKGPKSAMAEWVFPVEDRVHLQRPDGDGGYLSVMEPDGLHLLIGHVTGPQGPRSTLSHYEYVVQPYLSFEVFSLQDRVTQEQWHQTLRYAQENGLGAVRSQGFGRFKVVGFEEVK